jgi:hypothetical protein
MPYGVVLLPDRRVHDRLAALAAPIGGADVISLLGPLASAHVSVVHFDGDAGQAAQVGAWMARRAHQPMLVTIIGLLYAVVAAGDYYLPRAGCTSGLRWFAGPIWTHCTRRRWAGSARSAAHHSAPLGRTSDPI